MTLEQRLRRIVAAVTERAGPVVTADVEAMRIYFRYGPHDVRVVPASDLEGAVCVEVTTGQGCVARSRPLRDVSHVAEQVFRRLRQAGVEIAA